jgi:hypothetical protein
MAQTWETDKGKRTWDIGMGQDMGHGHGTWSECPPMYRMMIFFFFKKLVQINVVTVFAGCKIRHLHDTSGG